MDRDLARQGAVVAAVLAGIASGATGDYGDAEDSVSLVIPANYAFAIWAPVYVGSLAYAAHQARPSQRTDPLARRTGWPAATGYLLVGTWVRLRRRPEAQIPVIAATMGAAAWAYARSRRAEPEPARWGDTWAVRAPLGLFAGWVTLATAAGTTEALLAAGATDLGLGPLPWAVTVLTTAGTIAGVVTARVPASPAYPAAVVWGLAGVAMRATPRAPAAAVTAAVAAAGVCAAALPQRTRTRFTRPLRRLHPAQA